MRIDKIDPPSWFAGMTDNTLQLFVYGEGLKGIDANTSMGQIKRIISDDLYAIATLLLHKDCKDGVYNIFFKKNNQEIAIPYVLRQKKKVDHSRITPNDSIYLIMPDRFAKGKDIVDPKDLRPKAPNGWHGGNINGIREHLDYIKDLGVTTIWLTPVIKNNKKAFKGRYYSYHGYAITDFYEVDEHFGTIEDYRSLIKESHERGLKVVMDVVFNHCGSEHPWNNGYSPRFWINRNPMKSNYECTTIFGSYISRYDKEQTINGWFADTMPDLNLKNDNVLLYLTQMTFWWIETTSIDAIRMDTYLYSDNQKMNKWLKSLSKEYPNYSVIAETWIGNPAYTSKVQQSAMRATGKDNPLIIMDFAFQEKLSEAIYKRDLKIIYDHFIYDFLYPDAHQTLAFLDNHDMMRWARKHNDVADMKIALTILLTMPRIPQIFYGTEFMFKGTGDGKNHGNIRQDFLIGNDNNEIYDHIKKILRLRHNSTAITSGDMIQFLPQNGIYVYFRINYDDKLMILINLLDKPQEINLNRYIDEFEIKSFSKDVITGTVFEPCHISNTEVISMVEAKSVNIVKIETR